MPPAHSLLAAAAATAGIVASVSAGAAIVAAAAIAEEEQQDNDPPAVVSTAAIVAAAAIAAAIVATTTADQEQQDDDPSAIIPATVTAIPHMFASLFDKRTALLLRYSTRIRQDLCLFSGIFLPLNLTFIDKAPLKWVSGYGMIGKICWRNPVSKRSEAYGKF